MRLSEMDFSAGTPIDGYGPGFFRIAGARSDGPLFVRPGGHQSWAGLPHIAPILDVASDVDVIFFGMGFEIAHLPADLRTQLEASGLGVEVMATPAACRTYNVLLSEGRRIAAALTPV